MATSIDKQGQIHLPKTFRERFGDSYRIVGLPKQFGLFPVFQDPPSGVYDAVDDAVRDMNMEELGSKSWPKIVKGVRREAETREPGRNDR